MLTLRPFQTEALAKLRDPGHVICIAPTGAGKSLIYERLAAKSGVRALLVTPLTALAHQQAERLDAAGVRVALGAGGGLPGRFPKVPGPGIGAWVVSPEILAFEPQRRILARWRPGLLVVDECHCLWEWGESFRPAFDPLPGLIREHEIPRSLWLTATLPPEARGRLKGALPSPVHEVGKFDLPPALGLRVLRVPWVFRPRALVQSLRGMPGAGVIFVSTREAVLRVSRLLAGAGRTALPYHAGLSREERRAVEARVAARGPEVVVATSAFGMGMDFPHLGWVVLWQAPPSLLALAQSIGRAGRSGNSGQALVLWDLEDFQLLEWMARNSPRQRQELKNVLVYLERIGCRRAGLARHFNEGESAGSPRCPGLCDFCGGRPAPEALNTAFQYSEAGA